MIPRPRPTGWSLRLCNFFAVLNPLVAAGLFVALLVFIAVQVCGK